MQNVNKIYEFKKEALSDEVVDYVISNGLKPHSNDVRCDACLTNYKLAYYLVKQEPSLLYRVPENNLTEEIINMALDEGFKLKKDHHRLLSNQLFLKTIIKRDYRVLNYVEKQNITKEIIELATKCKYVFEFEGKRENLQLTYTSFGEDTYIQAENNLHLLGYDDLVLSSFNNGYKAIIFEEIINEGNKYYQYMIDSALTNKVPITNLRNNSLYKNSAFEKYIYVNLFRSDNSRELFEKYLKDGYVTGNLEVTSYVLSDEFVKVFGPLMVDMIMKYLICPKSEFKIDVVLKKVNERTLKQILDKFIDKEGQHVLFQIQKIVNYLSLNSNLIKIIMTLNDDELDNLKFIIFENNEDVKINDKDDLKNINSIRYDYYNSSEMNVKDKVFKYLTGCIYNEFEQVQKQMITSARYKTLLNHSKTNIKDGVKITLYLEYLEGLSKLNDAELFGVWKNIKNNKFRPMLLNDVINVYKKIYFDYYKANLTKLHNIKPSYYLENDIPVVEFNGESFSFFIHVFNSFEARYDSVYNISSMYENTVGRSYISTSYINENHYRGASLSKNGAIFIFGDFSNENFIAASPDDIYTNGKENNSLDVKFKPPSYLDAFEMSCLTYSFNEFAFYRVNNNGYRSLPSAVLCYDEITEREKGVAKNYQIPIVLIKTDAYKDLNEKLFNQYLEEVSNGNMKHIKELIGLSYKLHRALKEEELQNILEKVSDEEFGSICECLNLCKYNVDFLNEETQNEFKTKKLNIEENKN